MTTTSSTTGWAAARARYHFAARWARTRTVLTCGSGFGAQVLEEAGAIRVVVADREGLAALPDGTVDLVTCFADEEPSAPDDCILAELRRIVGPAGTVVVSSPVGPEPDGVPRFHTMLGRHFSRVSVLGQTPRDAYHFERRWLRAASRWLPVSLTDPLCRLFHDRTLHPGEYDWVFAVDAAPVARCLVAVCEP